MTQLLLLPGVPVTASRSEIAELTGKQHKHAMRDIRIMMETLKESPELDSACKTTAYQEMCDLTSSN